MSDQLNIVEARTYVRDHCVPGELTRIAHEALHELGTAREDVIEWKRVALERAVQKCTLTKRIGELEDAVGLMDDVLTDAESVAWEEGHENAFH